MIKNVLCSAPFTAILIDTNKGVRPCCVYENYIGNIKKNNVIEIINSDEWLDVKEKMKNNIWPTPCLSCKEREKLSNGWSVRYLFNNGIFDVTGWEEEKITYLEFNGSNICNLACLHCSPGFSSRWVKDLHKAVKIYETLDPTRKELLKEIDAVSPHNNDHISRSTVMHLPNDELVLENIKLIDLSNLRTINFKGGEPLLNSETLTILKYLKEQSIIQNVSAVFSSNGTYMNDEIINLLKHCKKVDFNISLDGIGNLFNYVRYGDAKFESIEPVVSRLSTLDNIRISFQCSVMNYNIFNLIDIRDWVNNISKKYNNIDGMAGFSNCVQSPNYLSIRTLSDETRYNLANLYQSKQIFNEFNIVISTLKNERLDKTIHNKWVGFTELMEQLRGNNILDIVPQLTTELKYI